MKNASLVKRLAPNISLVKEIDARCVLVTACASLGGGEKGEYCVHVYFHYVRFLRVDEYVVVERVCCGCIVTINVCCLQIFRKETEEIVTLYPACLRRALVLVRYDVSLWS